jgi:hypothetical protein
LESQLKINRGGVNFCYGPVKEGVLSEIISLLEGIAFLLQEDLEQQPTRIRRI